MASRRPSEKLDKTQVSRWVLVFVKAHRVLCWREIGLEHVEALRRGADPRYDASDLAQTCIHDTDLPAISTFPAPARKLGRPNTDPTVWERVDQIPLQLPLSDLKDLIRPQRAGYAHSKTEPQKNHRSHHATSEGHPYHLALRDRTQQ